MAALTLEEALEHVGVGRFQILLLFVCGIGYAAGTMELVLVAFLLPELEDEWDVGDYEQSILASTVFLGSMTGSVFFGWASDRYGRKFAFVASVVLSSVFGALSALSPSFEVLTAARFFVGFGLGGNLSVDFVLFLEFVSSARRGIFLNLITLFGIGGILLTAGISWATLGSGLSWRLYLVLCSLPSFAVFFMRIFLPESPRYLLVAGRSDDAKEVLERIGRSNGAELPAEWELEEEAVVTERASVSALLHPSLRSTTLLVWLMWFCVSIGYYGFTVWLPSYFELLEIDSISVYQSYLLMGLAEIPGLFLAIALVERKGRRFCLATFFLMCSAFMFAFALADSAPLLIGFSCGIYFSVVGVWATIYTYTPEVYPTTLRTTGKGIASIFAAGAGVISPPLGALLIDTSDGAYVPLVTYATFFALGGVAALFLKKETSGKRLADSLAAQTAQDEEDEDAADVHSRQRTTGRRGPYQQIKA